MSSTQIPSRGRSDTDAFEQRLTINDADFMHCRPSSTSIASTSPNATTTSTSLPVLRLRPLQPRPCRLLPSPRNILHSLAKTYLSLPLTLRTSHSKFSALRLSPIRVLRKLPPRTSRPPPRSQSPLHTGPQRLPPLRPIRAIGQVRRRRPNTRSARRTRNCMPRCRCRTERGRATMRAWSEAGRTGCTMRAIAGMARWRGWRMRGESAASTTHKRTVQSTAPVLTA